MTIRALIVDDENLARQSIRRMLKSHEDVAIVGECGDGESAISAVKRLKPQLLFLDIQMPEMNGFEVLREIGTDVMPVTIFITAYDRYAVQAFDASATDYLLKPIDRQRFDRALARARQQLNGKFTLDEARNLLESLNQLQSTRNFVERLPVSAGGRVIFVRTKDIDWIQADGNYAILHVGDKTHDLRETLTNLERKLSAEHFVRIHRSTIVNVNRIKEIHPWFHGHHVLVMEGGQHLRMSRYQLAVAKRLGIA